MSEREKLKIHEIYSSGDSMQLYMRSAREVALLTPQEEVDLARRVRGGDEKAREHMILANLRLVVKIAFEYKDLGLPLLDLISAGNMGLTKAVGKYNPDKGAKFSTYAGWWIKQSIKKMLSDESRVVRVPIYIIHLSNGARKARSEFKEAYGREPSDEEVAGIIDVSPEKLQEVSEVISTKYCSLDAPLGHDTENTVGSVIEDDNAQIPGSGGLDDIQRDVMKHLDRLTEREKYVLTKRFGLDNTKTVSLEVLGQRFGITRERVRQIQNQALAKLRSIMEKRNRIECDPTHPFRK